jgi:hypothetical protein
MKKNEVFELAFNPYIRIAGLQAFGIGIIINIIIAVIANYRNIYFDGVLDMHFVKISNLINAFTIMSINIAVLTIIMWIAGLLVTRNFRFIDILGTMTLAKTPYLILAIVAFFIPKPNIETILQNPISILNNTSLIIFTILSIPITIWYITLMYNALKVSCDIKGLKLNITFISALIIAEIVSKALISMVI